MSDEGRGEGIWKRRSSVFSVTPTPPSHALSSWGAFFFLFFYLSTCHMCTRFLSFIAQHLTHPFLVRALIPAFVSALLTLRVCYLDTQPTRTRLHFQRLLRASPPAAILSSRLNKRRATPLCVLTCLACGEGNSCGREKTVLLKGVLRRHARLPAVARLLFKQRNNGYLLLAHASRNCVYAHHFAIPSLLLSCLFSASCVFVQPAIVNGTAQLGAALADLQVKLGCGPLHEQLIYGINTACTTGL